MDVIREKELEAVEGKSRDAGLESRDKPCTVYLLRFAFRGKDSEILIAPLSFITSLYFHETRKFPALFTPARKDNAIHKHAPYF
jgi:hypothetical protein